MRDLDWLEQYLAHGIDYKINLIHDSFVPDAAWDGYFDFRNLLQLEFFNDQRTENSLFLVPKDTKYKNLLYNNDHFLKV